MWRKKATPAPAFRQPAPYNPVSGEHAQIGEAGIFSRAAMFRVVKSDSHANYVVCQGYDLDSDGHCQWMIPQIAVAKPYAIRGTYPYQVGWVIAAVKTRTIYGDNPGKAKTSTAQPANLDEDIVALKDYNDVPIEWLDISTGNPPVGPYWLGYNGGAIEHKIPNTPGESYGVGGVTHDIMFACGIRVDDCGHVQAYHNGFGWVVPEWGRTEP